MKWLLIGLHRYFLWLAVVPLVIVVLFACGQIGLAEIRFPALTNNSNLIANYSPWMYSLVKPADPTMVAALRNESPSIPATAMAFENLGLTTTPQTTSYLTEIASLPETFKLTPTQPGSARVLPSATRSSAPQTIIPLKTPTPRPSSTPVVEPSSTPVPSSTTVPSSTPEPSSTTEPSSTPEPSSTSKPTRTPTTPIPPTVAPPTPKPPTNQPPTETPEPTRTQKPTATNEPSKTPKPTETAKPVAVLGPVIPTIRFDGHANQNSDGTCTAYFGYYNPNKETVTIKIGGHNHFVPGKQDRGQPTEFLPGRHTNAFSVTWDDNRDLVWKLDGSDVTAIWCYEKKNQSDNSSGDSTGNSSGNHQENNPVNNNKSNSGNSNKNNSGNNNQNNSGGKKSESVVILLPSAMFFWWSKRSGSFSRSYNSST